jgi:meso-butanediol dehydrogenase / (S,S)-butanediol dehydrogenase / diacetyl reductase
MLQAPVARVTLKRAEEGAVGRLDGKVAIVTGAAGGIGRAIVQAFAREGARVTAGDLDESGLAQLQASAGAPVRAQRCDVSREDDVRTLVEDTIAAFGGLHVMCNNAGISPPGLVTEVSAEEFDRVIGVNLKGTFFGCKHAIRPMLASGGGSIINLGSANSLIAEPYLSAYCASKGGILMLSKAVALDFASQGIRCNCVCPGWVNTPINWPHAQRMGGVERMLETLPDWQPIGRPGLPEEVAAVAVFLASDESSFMTGSAVVVDGGMTAR